MPHCDSSLAEVDDPMKGLETLVHKIQPTKSTKADPSDEDMWKVIYTTIFPNDPKNQIPSPYYETGQERNNPFSLHGSTDSIQRELTLPWIHTPESQSSSSSQRGTDESADDASIYTRATSVSDGHIQDVPLTEAEGESSRCKSPKISGTRRNMFEFSDDANDGSMADSIGRESPNMRGEASSGREEEASNIREGALSAREEASSTEGEAASNTREGAASTREGASSTKDGASSTKEEALVTAFRAWEKPHRTDEHITPGAYQGFWKCLARGLTFYVPSWFLKKFYKMDDARQRMAYRQKVLCCLLLAVIYGLLCYFLIIQPMATCVMKVDIGMISADSQFCTVVTDVIYVYMGMGGVFMLLVAVCAALVRYRSRAFEEHDALLVMHIPCYNEDESVLRKTIQSCVESSYEKKRKLLFIVADGMVAAAGQKPTYKVLLENIFEHKEDLEIGIDNQAQWYTSFDTECVSENRAFCCTGYFQGVPYVLVVKVGREDEKDAPKPGNRGKRDSQLLVYNFFHYVNYRRFWTPLFENLEFKIRSCLNMDACDATYMLVVDCDTEVERTGISYLVDQLQKDPKLLGVCGYTGVSNPRSSFIACSQVFEYWLTHAVLKAVESTCSNVLVLSRCFTIYRLKWSNNRPAILHPLLLEDYAGTYDKTLHEHNLLSIGEDRYLSTLAIRYFGADCKLQYFSAAKCSTMVPEQLSVLLDQRRRWTNSLIHCHFAHLNVLPFEASFWTKLCLLFVIGAELFMVFILPLALPAGLVVSVISIWLVPYAWAIMLAFSLIPVLICILCMDWEFILYYIPYFPMIAVFSIIIPVFSLWKQDNIKWGKTRDG
ncbi:chitin synthase-domain-containing protein [Xylariales sp. PMI_506]|nr:chitin synthase-domain-containing protein [Xylariales sp. PMI_506]